MIIGDRNIGIIAKKFNNEQLDAYIININLFPFSFWVQSHLDTNHYEVKIELFNKINFGFFVKY
jgi:hypothetical protein|tara:strand:- start:5256 stop:5447 length:192 start_codon:yes stop_codon:yes gene_type:complete